MPEKTELTTEVMPVDINSFAIVYKIQAYTPHLFSFNMECQSRVIFSIICLLLMLQSFCAFYWLYYESLHFSGSDDGNNSGDGDNFVMQWASMAPEGTHWEASTIVGTPERVRKA